LGGKADVADATSGNDSRRSTDSGLQDRRGHLAARARQRVYGQPDRGDRRRERRADRRQEPLVVEKTVTPVEPSVGFGYLAAASEAHSVALRAASRGVPVSQAMMSHFVTLQPDTHIDEAVNVLLQTSQGTFPVVDGNGSFVGALDRANILQSVKQAAPDARVDAVATVIGSWSFIIVQSAILFVWITANLVGAIRGWDPYPFILLNLALSFQAAYAAPVIMMSQNQQQDIDRRAAENDCASAKSSS
jgi:CBS domain-containing protein